MNRTVKVIVALLVLATVITGIYAYREHQAATYLRLRSENMYQQAFHSLVDHVDSIEVELSRALATSDTLQQMNLLSAVWRQVYAAQQELGKLPLALVQFSNTEKFLSNVGDFTFNVAKDSVNGYILSGEEWKTLATLKKCSVSMSRDLRKMQESIMVNNLRWTDVEMAVNKNETRDNSVINGLELFDEKVHEYTEVDVGTRINVVKPPAYNLSRGKLITQDEATTAATRLVEKAGGRSLISVGVVENNGEIPAWTVSLRSEVSREVFTCDISKHGGDALWLISDGQIGNTLIDLDRARHEANSFLESVGLMNMELVGFEEYQGEALFVYAHNDSGIIVYPDLVRVRIRMDTGTVSGLEATDYVKYHHDRKIPMPEISQEDASSKVRPELTILQVRTAVIFDESAREILTYEFSASGAKENFIVYISAIDGREVQILRIDDDLLAKPASSIGN